MTAQLPQLHQGRDGETQVIKLLNQLRRNSPLPTLSLQPAGPINLLTTGLTTVIPANGTGWITTAAYVIADVITGAQSTGPVVGIGTAGTYDNVFAPANLGTTLVVGELVVLTLVAPSVSLTDVIALNVSTAATGPTELSATLYLEGFFR